MTRTNEHSSDRTIVIEHTVNAPHELVWEAWTNPEHVAKWCGPNGFTTTIHQTEVRSGGVWRFRMHAPDGTTFPVKIVFRELTKPERLVYDHSNDDGRDIRDFQGT